MISTVESQDLSPHHQHISCFMDDLGTLHLVLVVFILVVVLVLVSGVYKIHDKQSFYKPVRLGCTFFLILYLKDI